MSDCDKLKRGERLSPGKGSVLVFDERGQQTCKSFAVRDVIRELPEGTTIEDVTRALSLMLQTTLKNKSVIDVADFVAMITKENILRVLGFLQEGNDEQEIAAQEAA